MTDTAHPPTRASAMQPPDAQEQRHVRGVLLRMAYTRLRLSLILTLTVLAAFIGLFVPHFGVRPLVLWGGAIAAVAFARWLDQRAFHLAAPAAADHPQWQARLVVGAFAAGLAWAAGPLALIREPGHAAAYLLALSLLAVSAVAMASLTAHRSAMFAFQVAALLPTGIAFIRTEGATEILAGMIVLAGLLMLMAVGHDSHGAVRAQQEAEYRLAGARRQLYDALEALDVGVLMLDPDERVILCNQVYRTVWAPGDDALAPGSSLDEVLRAEFRHGGAGPDVRDEAAWVAERRAERSRPDTGPQVRQVQVGGRWYRCDDTRTPVGVTISLRTDITDQVSRLHDIRRARDVAEAASRAKSRFLANMSHELRTPLNAVIGAAQLMHAEGDDPRQRDYLSDAIQRSGQNLLGLIENILDLSRIEAGELRIQAHDFHLPDCIEAARVTAGLAARAKGLRLSVETAPGLSPWRRGDEARLRQVVLNLLGNAVKFTGRGEVRLELAERDGGVLLSVSDTGIGIPASALASIFEPFRQADEGADRRYGGSGLGLAIVQQTVQAMGGTVSVHSSEGRGARFDLWLPLPAVERAGVAGVGLPQPQPQPPDATAPAAAGAGRVLVVEDDALNREIVSRLLTHAGYRVIALPDGSSALQHLVAADAGEREPVGLVLMDGQMPDMDGLEATRRIRAMRSASASVPIVALTANAFAEDREACLRSGMNDFLTKPVDAVALARCVARWMRAQPEPMGETPPDIGGPGGQHGCTFAAPAAEDDRGHSAAQEVVFDPSVLAALPMVADGSDPGYADEVLGSFLQAVPGQLDALAHASGAADRSEALRLVHSLKSTAACVGAAALSRRCASLEAGLRAGLPVQAGLDSELRHEFARLQHQVGLVRADVPAGAQAA